MTRKKKREPVEETDLDKGVEEMLHDALLLLAPDVERETKENFYEELGGLLEITAKALAMKGDEVNAAVANSLAERAWIFAHEAHLGETSQEYRAKYIEAWCAKHDPDTPVH